MSICLALVDYIPVILFALTGILLMRDLYNKLSKGAFALMSAGIIMALVAGLYKATWKLVYCLGTADLYLLNNAFMPIQAAGFLVLGIGLTAGTFFPQGKNKMFAVAPLTAIPQERGTVVFIIFMAIGCLGFCGSLTKLAAKMKKIPAVVLYVVSFVLFMGMGYLGSREFGNDPKMNWTVEGVNVCAELCLFFATRMLHKSGLARLESL